jgi:DNA-binding NarL/FixJ family response regulator
MSIPCIVRVLVVDNDYGTRRQVVRILRTAGCLARAAEGQGVELEKSAKHLARIFKPHVVVMDLRLSDEHADDRSGLDLWMDNFSSARCILYSAYLNQNYKITREALRQEGIENVIGKEEDPQILVDAVRDAARKGCGCRNGLLLEWPDAWNEEVIVKSIFKNPNGMPSHLVSDVFGRLFPETKNLDIRALEETAVSPMAVARGRAVLFQVWPDDKEPVVIKLSEREKIHVEAKAYNEHIKDRLVGRFYAELKDVTYFWDIGGICYSFMGSSQKPLESFASFYRHTQQPDEIIRPLEHLFGEVWRRHYSATRSPLTESLFTEYASFLKLREGLDEFPIRESILTIPEFSGQYLNPATWILAHAEESLIPSAQLAITHGDLHGDNLFVDEDHSWAIDFERSGRGHSLRDFVELEEDIITRLYMLPENNMYLFYNFVIALTRPLFPSEPIMIPHCFEKDLETRKALAVIEGLRSIAYQVTGYQDMREHYWGLLLDAFFSLKLTEPGTPKWTRSLLLSSLLCARLEQWENEDAPIIKKSEEE